MSACSPGLHRRLIDATVAKQRTGKNRTRNRGAADLGVINHRTAAGCEYRPGGEFNTAGVSAWALGKNDVYAQPIQTFKNIKEAFASSGAKTGDVVKLTTYLTDMADYPGFSRARAETFPGGVPSSSTVASPALIMPNLLVESNRIESMAIIGSGE